MKIFGLLSLLLTTINSASAMESFVNPSGSDSYTGKHGSCETKWRWILSSINDAAYELVLLSWYFVIVGEARFRFRISILLSLSLRLISIWVQYIYCLCTVQISNR